MQATPQGRKGAVLLFVLGILFMLASLLTVFVSRMQYQIQLNLRDSTNSELRQTAYSALDVCLAVMQAYKKMDGSLYAPSQGWQDAIELADVEFPDADEVRLRFVDETGKIPLAGANMNRMAQVLEGLGFDEYTALQMLDKYQDWVDEDDLERLNGAEKEYYMDRPIPYEPANQNLLSMSEFRLIGDFDLAFFDAYGQGNELFEVFESFYSTRNSGSVNVNTMDPRLALLDETTSVYEQESFWAYLAGDDGERGTADDRYFTNTQQVPKSISGLEGLTLGARVNYLWVIVEVIRGGQSFTLRALVSVGGGNPLSQNRKFDRFRREEQVYSYQEDQEEVAEANNIHYPFTILEIREDENEL